MDSCVPLIRSYRTSPLRASCSYSESAACVLLWPGDIYVSQRSCVQVPGLQCGDRKVEGPLRVRGGSDLGSITLRRDDSNSLGTPVSSPHDSLASASLWDPLWTGQLHFLLLHHVLMSPQRPMPEAKETEPPDLGLSDSKTINNKSLFFTKYQLHGPLL